MTKLPYAALFACIFLPNVLVAQPPTRSGYEIAWSDEFSSTSLNTSLWWAQDNPFPTNDSLHDYQPGQVSVSGGNLVIKSENLPGRNGPGTYLSGAVTSTALQKYGRWDVRAKLPTSAGMWPAIWLLSDAPWPSQGEIDIMENRGTQPTLTSSAFHYGDDNPFEHKFTYTEQTSVHDGANVNYHNSFHTYSVEWDPKQIRFYVDDVHHWTVRDSQVNGFLTGTGAYAGGGVGPMRLNINTAIGGTFLPPPDSSTIWPQEFQIDYVHAYTKSATPTILTFENGGFEDQGGSLAHWRNRNKSFY